MFAVRADFTVCVTGASVSGNTWTYTVLSPNGFSEESNAGKSFDWYLFDRPADLGSRSGLVVRDAQSRITFDAAQKYARVRGIMSVGDGDPPSVEFGSGVLACVTTRISIITAVSTVVPGSRYTYDVSFRGFAIQGTAVTCKGWLAHHQDNAIAPDGPYPNLRTGEVLVLDVTNY